MVRALHAAGHRGDPRRRLQPHRRRRARTARCCPSAASTTRSYYRLAADDPSQYVDYTGCGNTFDPRRPFPLQLIMDSLRYWITEMHVDGFRFDLASALARSLHDVDKLSSFFDTIHQDPVISQVKLIAEPWDVGAGGYQVGEFPPLWTEWNGKLPRHGALVLGARRADGVRDLAFRLTGSSDLYGDDGRLPIASINFVTAHDGFTMRDLVSYERKHNEANGEDNRDGTDDNRSYNCRRRGRPGAGRGGAAAAAGRRATCSPRCCCRPARRCWWPATSGGARSAATTTPTARTTRCPGWTGRPAERPTTCCCWSGGCCTCAATHPVLRQPAFFEGRAGRGRRRLQGPGLVPPGRSAR